MFDAVKKIQRNQKQTCIDIYKKGNEMSNFSSDTIQKKFYILL